MWRIDMSGLVHEFEKLETAIRHLFNWANASGYEVVIKNAFPIMIVARDAAGGIRGTVTGIPKHATSVSVRNATV